MSNTPNPNWLHDLRNAVNSACVAIDVVKRALESNDTACAREFIKHAEKACGHSRELLVQSRGK